ncbi:hypothetical protein ABFS83_01G105100 [Erythranthe nasuta]
MSHWMKKMGMRKRKGPLIRPPVDPVEESTAEREGKTHNRNVTSSKYRGERTGVFVQPRMTIEKEEETEAEPEQEMDTYMHPHEDEYDPGLCFQEKYQFPAPDLPSDDDDEDDLTPPPPPAYTMAGTSGGSTSVPNPRSRPGPKKSLPT